MINKLKKVWVYIFLIITSIISVGPFAWMVIGATNSSKDVTLGKLTIGNEFFINFRNLNQIVDIKQAFLNSSQIAIIQTIVALLLCSMAGYGFEVYKSKNRDRLFTLLILSMMLPFAAMMIPLFKMFSKLGVLNTNLAVILPTAATAFLIFFFRQNTKSFPKELIEAARVDGLNEFMIFLKIYMPTMKSTYSAAAIITFMSSWNSFLWPLISLQTPDKRTLPLVISSISSAYKPDYGMIMVAIIISVLPTLLIFFLLQKHFVEGMVGSIK